MAWFDAHMERLRPKILAALAKGPVEDRASGRATGLLTERLGDEDAGYVSNALIEMERRGEIVREVKGRRTYLIRLPKMTDDMPAILAAVEERVALLVSQRMAGTARNKAAKAATPAPRGLTLVPEPAAAAAAPATTVPAAASPVPVADNVAEVCAAHQNVATPPTKPANLIDYGQLAKFLLEQVVDAASAPARQSREVADMQKRLGEQTEETQRLRTKLREAQDLAAATALERDGLRDRAQRAEANLAKVTGVRPLDTNRERELRDLARVMQAKPGAYAANIAK